MPRKIRTYSCQWCNKPFESRIKDASGCSPSCRGKLNRTRQGCPPWHLEEVALLEKLAGSKPFEDIVAAVQRLDRRKGWPVRTPSATKSELLRRQIQYKCCEDNLTVAMLAKTLGVTSGTVHSWRRSKGLPARKLSVRRVVVSLKQFREWATAHPDQLKGLEYERLLWVLEDEKLAQELSEGRVNRPGERVRVRRVDTKEVFPSLEQAVQSKGVYLHQSALSHHVQQGKRRFTSGGIEWEVVA